MSLEATKPGPEIIKLFSMLNLTEKKISTNHIKTKIVSEYDQEIPQSQSADNPMAPRG